MEEQKQDETQVLETESTEEATATAEETTADTQVDEDIENLKAKAAKVDELEAKNKQLFERAKKAESSKSAPSDELSVTDAVVLMQSGVKAEHFKEVIQAAKVLGVSIPDALKTNVVKTILAQRVEEEKTASATQTKGQARGTHKVTSEEILQKFQRGDLPNSDDEFADLAKARMFRNKPNARR